MKVWFINIFEGVFNLFLINGDRECLVVIFVVIYEMNFFELKFFLMLIDMFNFLFDDVRDCFVG